MPTAFEMALDAARGGRPCFLALIQNFRRCGGYNAIALEPDAERAQLAVANSGQRHPGFVVLIEFANAGPLCPEASDPGAAEQYELFTGTPVVLVGWPSLNVPSRCEVRWAGGPRDNLAAAVKVAKTVPWAAMAGHVRAIESSEDGPFGGYSQTRRNAIGIGIP